MTVDCEYCRKWNQENSESESQTSCGPCEICRAPGHLKAHPRKPASICLCQQHWDELNASGYHFDLSHLLYVIVLAIAAVQIYPLIARLWGG